MTQKSTMSIRHALALVAPLVIGAALMPAGCSADADPNAVDENTDVFGMSYEEFKATVYQEPDTGIWIVNGDTPIADERELKDFYTKFIAQGALSIHTAGGVDAKWTDQQKVNLTYCVSNSGTGSFGANHAKAVAAMQAAGNAWSAAANVKFVYNSAQNGSCTASNNNVVFDVRLVNSGGQYLARAFFPNSSRSGRNVLIDTTAFGALGQWTLEGILRHELGHVLGFRHEHTRPEAGTCFEDNNYRPLTPYDNKSVMHYPQCNGAQQGDLVITAYDTQGAQSIYGAPGGGNPPPPPPASCEHDKCATGGKLTAANCDSCVQAVCQNDPYCCNTAWDSVCVGKVQSVCGQSCGGVVACAHSKCVTGVALKSGCGANGVADACVQKIITADPYCGSTSWDGTCVGEVKTVCNISPCQ